VSPAARVVRGFGWLSIAAGLLIVLYLAYALLFTTVRTDQAQSELRERWDLEVGQVAAPVAAPAAVGAAAAPPSAIPDGEAMAMLEFARPGEPPPVHDEPLLVVQGVGVPDLRKGPGHYPESAEPGQVGNFSVAGHRSTYGAPFYNLDQLRAGDEVHVTDRAGTRFTYRVLESRIVGPGDESVLRADALGPDRSLLTLTTCHPRFSNRQRLIVHAELV
jgi:sortase A